MVCLRGKETAVHQCNEWAQAGGPQDDNEAALLLLLLL
jgi:hypothetical protein